MLTTWDSIQKSFHHALDSLYGPREVKALFTLSASEVSGLKRHEIWPDGNASPYDEAMASILDRLKQTEPIQYILGKTTFMNLEFQLGPGALIPRPETEWIVDLLLKKMIPPPTSWADVCCGSGCMGISLAKHWLNSKGLLLDISEEALQWCRLNAKNLLADPLQVTIQPFDVLSHVKPLPRALDAIVSNPPYVPKTEAQALAPWVIEHEPDIALFPPGDDAFLFYRKLGELAMSSLKSDGWLAAEIHADGGPTCRHIFENSGLTRVEIHQDMSGIDRLIIGWKP